MHVISIQSYHNITDLRIKEDLLKQNESKFTNFMPIYHVVQVKKSSHRLIHISQQ